MLRKNWAGLTLLGWLKALPAELIGRPVLCCGFAWGLMAQMRRAQGDWGMPLISVMPIQLDANDPLGSLAR